MDNIQVTAQAEGRRGEANVEKRDSNFRKSLDKGSVTLLGLSGPMWPLLRDGSLPNRAPLR